MKAVHLVQTIFLSFAFLLKDVGSKERYLLIELDPPEPDPGTKGTKHPWLSSGIQWA